MNPESPEPAPSRRDFLSGLVTTTLFIAGCGGGSDGGGSAAADIPVTPSNPTVPTGEVPVVVARQLGPEPVAVPGVDAGIRISALISAARGGQFDIPGGARLTIPAGALAADTEVVVVVPTAPRAGEHAFFFGPSGTRFSTPARLAMAIPAANDLSVVFAIHSSVLNGVVNVGSEKTDFQPLKAVSRTATHITFEVEHFSYLNAIEAIDAGAYLVTDIPGECLSPGDLMFYLTNFDATNQKQWRPGHVAMLVKDDGGNRNDPSVKRAADLLVESGGDAGGVGFSTIAHTQFSHGHVYLGPYRHPQGLSKEQQDTVRSFLFSKLGKEYSMLGVQGAPLDLVQAEKYSCVGLCDAALRGVGKGLLSFFNRANVTTPIEFFRRTVPVTEIEVKAGKQLEIPVYGVIVSDSALGNVPLAGLGLVGYSRRVAYDVAPLKFPKDSTFVATQLRASGDVNDRAPGYLFSWFPKKEQIGQVFELELELVTRRANLTQVIGAALLRDEVRRVIKMKVIPGSQFRYLDNAITDRFVNVGKDGTVVYSWLDANEGRRRMSRLNPPVANGELGPETILDIDARLELVEGNANNVVLAQLQESLNTTPPSTRHSFLAYTVAAGASQNSTTLATVNVTLPPAGQVINPPGIDAEYKARAFSSNGDVVGTLGRYRRGPDLVNSLPRVDVWWIPKGGAITAVAVHAAFHSAIVSANPQPGITRAEELFGLKVLDVNSAGVVLLAASISVSVNGGFGLEVAAASYNLNTGHITLLAYLFEQRADIAGPDAIYAGRINDAGQVVISRAQGIRSGGIVAQYHEGLPSRQPKPSPLLTKPNFWVNTFTSTADAGGFLQVDGVSKAAVWRTGADELVDVHAQLIALDPTLKSTYASSVARVGDDGTLVGAVVAKRLTAPQQPPGDLNPEIDWVRNFVIGPG